MAASEAQIKANRENAKKSTGPRTEAGKSISRMNATRHGLTGQYFCISETDAPAYKAFEETMLANLKPIGSYEDQLAIAIVQNQWRLNRSRGIEFNLYGRGHDKWSDRTDAASANIHSAAIQAETYHEDHKVMNNVTLYESRIRRFIAQDRRELKDLQAERIAAEQEAARTAANLLKLADTLGQEGEPVLEEFLIPDATPTKIKVDGFVFALAEIERQDRLRRLTRIANDCDKLGWSPQNVRAVIQRAA